MRQSKALSIAVLTIAALGATLLAGPAQQKKPAPNASAAPKRTQPEFFVMIDAGHGGDDRGAALGGKLVEKDVTLALAKALRSDLEDRGIPVRLLRETDVTIGLDRRAEIANEQRTAVYVALHATSGEGVRVYTSMAEPPSPAAVKLTPWENAQTAFLSTSQLLATSVVGELKRRKVEATRLAAPLRPLNNVTAPAIAVEVSLGPKDTRRLPESLQESVVSAVTAAIIQARTKIGLQL